MSSIVRRTTRGKAKALIDLSNVSNRNKRKQAESDNNSRELNVSAPDSRPARLTASLVIDMSASREQEHGQKQAVVLENVNNKSSQPPTQKKKKKKKMTRKRQTITIKEEEEEEYKEDFELECEEKFPKKQRGMVSFAARLDEICFFSFLFVFQIQNYLNFFVPSLPLVLILCRAR
jgi:hypothetical protein